MLREADPRAENAITAIRHLWDEDGCGCSDKGGTSVLPLILWPARLQPPGVVRVQWLNYEIVVTQTFAMPLFKKWGEQRHSAT